MLYTRYIIVHPFHLFDIAMATYNKYTCSYTLFVTSSRRHFHTNQWYSLLFSILKLTRWSAVQPFWSDIQHYRYICRIDKIWQATDLFQERRDTQSARGKENTRQAIGLSKQTLWQHTTPLLQNRLTQKREVFRVQELYQSLHSTMSICSH